MTEADKFEHGPLSGIGTDAAAARDSGGSRDAEHGQPATRPGAEFYKDLEADERAGVPGEMALDVILDIPVTMTMEIGQTRISVRNLLELGRGSIVELDRLAGEPMDVKVNGVLIAHGEVVVVNEKYGIRLTDVVRPAEWIRKLK